MVENEPSESGCRGSPGEEVSIRMTAAAESRKSLPPPLPPHPLPPDIAEDTVVPPPSAKDGGYGWVVLASAVAINAVGAGYVKSFGILYTLILDYFPDASGAAGSWIMSLLVATRQLLAPVCGAFTLMLGPRLCVTMGGALAALALMMSVPAFSIWYMAFTLGALTGLGICIAETPGYILVTDYFEEKRALANGFRASGNPLGGLIFGPLVVFLQQEFGFRGALFILSAIMLQIVVLGLLMRPFELHKEMIEEKHKRKMRKINQDDSNFPANERNVVTAVNDGSRSKQKRKPLEFRLLLNPQYQMYLLVAVFASVGIPNAYMYLAKYGRMIGLSDYQNSIIVSYISMSDFLTRIACGYVTSKKIITPRQGFASGLILGAVGCMTVPLCTNMWQMILASTLVAVCLAFYWALINTIMAEDFGGDTTATTWGFFRMTQGIFSFVCVPLVGFVMDKTGGLTIPYIMMGSFKIIAAAIFSLQPYVARLSCAKDTSSQ